MKKNLIFKIVALFILPLILLSFIELFSFFVLKNFEKTKKFRMDEFVNKKNSSFSLIQDFPKVRSQLLDKSCKKIIYYDVKKQLPYYSNPNHKCEGETVEGGFRKTHYQNKNTDKKIYVFGGSTVWGTGSSDQFTIPSILQKNINSSKKIIDKYNVYNYGFSTLVSHQQFKLLKQVNLNKGDIVIFYDGNNDIWQANINKNPFGTIIGYNNKNKFSILKNKTSFFLNNNSNLFKLIQKVRKTEKLKCSVLETNINDIEKNFKIYFQATMNAKTFTEEQQANFYHFFQPTLFTRKAKTVFEKYMISTLPSQIMPCNSAGGLFENSTQYYSKMYNQFKSDINGYNLGNIFDKSTEDYFIDLTHVNSRGNIIIAKKIFDLINFD